MFERFVCFFRATTKHDSAGSLNITHEHSQPSSSINSSQRESVPYSAMVSFGRHPIVRPWHMLLICLFSVTALASLLERPQVVLSKQNSPEIKGTAHQDALSCRNLLKTTRGTVVYTHGAESADPSSSGLRTCLLSGMAASFRPAIHTIMVEYPEKPGSATEHSVEQPLLDIIDVLPRLQRVRLVPLRLCPHTVATCLYLLGDTYTEQIIDGLITLSTPQPAQHSSNGRLHKRFPGTLKLPSTMMHTLTTQNSSIVQVSP